MLRLPQEQTPGFQVVPPKLVFLVVDTPPLSLLYRAGWGPGQLPSPGLLNAFLRCFEPLKLNKHITIFSEKLLLFY